MNPRATLFNGHVTTIEMITLLNELADGKQIVEYGVKPIIRNSFN